MKKEKEQKEYDLTIPENYLDVLSKFDELSEEKQSEAVRYIEELGKEEKQKAQ